MASWWSDAGSSEGAEDDSILSRVLHAVGMFGDILSLDEAMEAEEDELSTAHGGEQDRAEQTTGKQRDVETCELKGGVDETEMDVLHKRAHPEEVGEVTEVERELELMENIQADGEEEEEHPLQEDKKDFNQENRGYEEDNSEDKVTPERHENNAVKDFLKGKKEDAKEMEEEESQDSESNLDHPHGEKNHQEEKLDEEGVELEVEERGRVCHVGEQVGEQQDVLETECQDVDHETETEVKTKNEGGGEQGLRKEKDPELTGDILDASAQKVMESPLDDDGVVDEEKRGDSTKEEDENSQTSMSPSHEKCDVIVNEVEKEQEDVEGKDTEKKQEIENAEEKQTSFDVKSDAVIIQDEISDDKEEQEEEENTERKEEERLNEESEKDSNSEDAKLEREVIEEEKNGDDEARWVDLEAGDGSDGNMPETEKNDESKNESCGFHDNHMYHTCGDYQERREPSDSTEAVMTSLPETALILEESMMTQQNTSGDSCPKEQLAEEPTTEENFIKMAEHSTEWEEADSGVKMTDLTLEMDPGGGGAVRDVSEERTSRPNSSSEDSDLEVRPLETEEKSEAARYQTVSYRRIRKGNTRQRIDHFESMLNP
ncbi:trichohyalin-like [Synchiropus splendidus]|uniref:trichohyalin-like n=1 Tax=Synchiropus splendidus TaxID=270530 RepID=UPI00237E122F|nr:trichohyalin-like [Synchiropus splendidus]